MGIQTTGSFQYYHEDSGFASAPADATLKVLGRNSRLTRAEGSNNAVPDYDPNSRLIQDLVERNFRGSWSAEARMVNPWFLHEVLDRSPSTTDNADGSYTHTFDPSTSIPYSMRILAGSDEAGDERVLLGAIVATCTVRVSVQGEVMVSLSGAYADEGTLPGSVTAQASPSHRTLTYGSSNITVGGGTAFSLVQDATVTLDTGLSLVDELNNRFAADFSAGPLQPSVEFTKLTENTDTVKEMYGSGAATEPEDTLEDEKVATFTVDNGSAPGSGINQFVFDLNGSISDTQSWSGIGDPTQPVQDEVNRRAQDCVVAVTNEVSTPV